MPLSTNRTIFLSMPLPYRSVLNEPVIRRVRVTPDKPDGFPQRAPRTRRPHGEAQVAAVRHLIENTELTYSEIERKTGVGRASICRWTKDQKWVRPVFAPRATDTVPRARASAKLKRRTLAARLDALAERYVRDLEADPGVDLDKLAAALELAKMAKLAAMPRKRRRTLAHERREATDATLSPLVPAKAGTQGPQAHESVADTLARLRAEGVRLDRAPEAAVKDFIDSHRPPEDDRALRPRGTRSRRVRAHRRMFDWGRD
ncbi:hypothetical protein [Pseudorhodoplanes sp.]|uniref:hypothetical protein n=1 Tax=Pseudorhodoplanes sp. TaxID=1934341 RepID=UPI003D114F34